MSFGVTAVVVAGTAVAYSAYEQNRAAQKQREAIKKAGEAQAAATAKAETDAQVAANADAAEAKRRRLASTLGTGAPSSALGGGASGSPAATPKTSTLGGGAV